MAATPRLHAFDHLKAVAIVAVVFTHAGPDSWFAEGSAFVWFLTKSWTVFHVPSFLFVSGYLYARRQPIAVSGAAARLLRVVLPYLVWSCIAQLSGESGARSFGDVAYQFLTGSSLGVYYYVMLFSGCIVLMLPLSYLGRRGALVLWVVYTAYSVAAVVWPVLLSGDTLFWLMREPLQLYAFGFFLTGWLAALWRAELHAAHAAHPLAALVASSLMTTFGLLLVAGWLSFSFGYLDRAIYTFGVVSTFALLLSARPALPAQRFLADATLGIYLSHFLFILWVRPSVAGWPEVAGVAAQVAAGLGGGVAVCWLARRALGSNRASRWLGA